MASLQAAAIAHPNIALIKYWGDRDPILHLPANSSISINLDGLETNTTVTFDPSLVNDRFILDGEQVTDSRLERVSHFLEHVRRIAGTHFFARVESHNNFPSGTGIASSASGFAALALAASTAAGLRLDEIALSRLARLGSGSACRSIPTGFVEWNAGSTDEESYAFSIAPPGYWDLVDIIAVVSQAEKVISSATGHRLAETSFLQAARVEDTPRRLERCRRAILERDFDALAAIVELDSNMMHAVMMTSQPSLLYWQPETTAIIHAVEAMRKNGIPACYTIDAGPNVHVLCPGHVAEEVKKRLEHLPGVIKTLLAHPGDGARVIAVD